MNSIIKNTLESLNVPVSFQKHTESSDTYITFFSYDERGEVWADNAEIQTGYYVQVDVWSKTDYTKLVEDVIIKMKDTGFKRNYATDLYESDTNIYHKSIRFYYSK